MSDQHTDATRQLMASVHLDARFRDAVIHELYEHEERVAAPAYDFDAVPVLLEALRARRTARLWALPVALLWIAGFVLLGWLFAVYAVGALALFGAARVLGDRASPLPTAVVARRPPPTRWARLWGGVLRGFGRLALVGYAVLAVAWSGDWPLVRSVTPLDVAVPLTALMVVVTKFHRLSVVRQLTGIRSHSPSPRAPGASLARLGPAISRITRAQASRVVVHPPGDPFVGSGMSLEARCVTARLRPPERLDAERYIVNSLLDRIRSDIEDVRGLSQQVDDCLFLPDDEAGPASRPGGPPDARLFRSGGRDRSDPGTRVLRIVCHGPRSRLTTVFVRVGLVDPFLSVELHTYVLPPVRPDFAAAGRPRDEWQRNGYFLPLSMTSSMTQAFLRTPSTGAGGLAELAVWPVRWLRALSLLHGPEFTGPRVSIRELAAEPDLSEPELLDSHRIAGIVRQLVLDAVRDELAAVGLSAPGLTDGEQESYDIRGGIQIGNIAPGTMTTGSPGRATGPLRHTSPSPTTNPDDDSWDDDLG